MEQIKLQNYATFDSSLNSQYFLMQLHHHRGQGSVLVSNLHFMLGITMLQSYNFFIFGRDLFVQACGIAVSILAFHQSQAVSLVTKA